MAQAKKKVSKKRGSKKNLLTETPTPKKKRGRRRLVETGNAIIDRENAEKAAKRKLIAKGSGLEMKKRFLKKFVAKYGVKFLHKKWPKGEIDITYFNWFDMRDIAGGDNGDELWKRVKYDALAFERPARTTPEEMVVYDEKLASKGRPEKKPINPMELTKIKAMTLLDDCIEMAFSEADGQLTGKVLTYLRTEAVSPMLANMMANHFAADFEPNPDYPEKIKGEYSLEAQTENTKSLLEQLQLYAEEAKNMKRTRKTRITTKKKNSLDKAEKAISSFQYKKLDDELKISSADPIKIIGAKAILMHNTKYGRTTYLEAAPNGVLAVAGTSVKGFDPDKSIWKACPDPKDKLDWSTKAKALRSLKALNRKEYPGAGRSGKDTVILAIF